MARATHGEPRALGNNSANAGDRDVLVRALVVLFCLVGSWSCTHLQPRGEVLPSLSRDDQVMALPEGTKRVQVDNPWGDIHIRRGPSGEWSYHAVIQQLDAAAAELHMKPPGASAMVALQVRFAGHGADCVRRRRDGGRVGRVDLTVFVPAGLDVELLSACDGRISSDHVLGRMQVRNDSGGINVSAAGGADIQSVSGRVRAYVELAADSAVRSSGPIILTLPVATSGELEVSACGELIAEGFEWLPSGDRDGACRLGRATLGEGGSRMRVDSAASFVEVRLRGAERP